MDCGLLGIVGRQRFYACFSLLDVPRAVEEITYWKIKNSWGGRWADEGCARIAKSALDFVFFDIAFYENELTATDIQNYNDAPQSLKVTVDYTPMCGPGGISTGLEAGCELDLVFCHRDLTSSVAHPIGQGSQKDIFLVKNRGTGVTYALKVHKHSDKDLFVDMFDSDLAAMLAGAFNEGLVKFCVPVLAKVVHASNASGKTLKHWKGRTVLIEHFLEGSYRKFVFTPSGQYHDIPQSFVHFTYLASKKTSVIWDLQGVKKENGEYWLTDPQFVHSRNCVPEIGDQHAVYRALHHTCGRHCSELVQTAVVKRVKQHVSDVCARQKVLDETMMDKRATVLNQEVDSRRAPLLAELARIQAELSAIDASVEAQVQAEAKEREAAAELRARWHRARIDL
eukprot:TRINITY_DN79994_c0_g1_i1.p1 TRINITY_DN79994_c0_g1~~TRINITY_DN79994_c0_g1_i1.p1  ORF type:complete len:396 (-),score=39.78 TRINITY_DN79994_c0_g1_i1:356-1543(-)